MAYVMRHRKANGDTRVTRVDGDTESSFVMKYQGARGVIVKQDKIEVYGYNFRKGKKSAYLRTKEIREDLDNLRKEYSHTKGMSRKGTMRHVASIPPELWWREKANRGPGALRDTKELKRFCSEHDLNVTPSGSRW